ncbi:hypothetical protein KEM48_010229 [Puccinia striiformis f. sp. tritici PST-130]|uniref:Uncharacterized protein n=2 Tax=Puccinia striiformis TaxID=27350 RepID=A0A0L0VQ13_9BASI|nr:hypothetical protein KEM48_010229 [Puccinia striiformis f. sp. tritici PST-130]KNF01302.1 hypothetical protein PSTG_05400 [Puccinia striiformis f. sp. tritici PST-78]POW05694.1 hypothetical protein PSTT_09484 [Puccinia striiformis]
MALVQQNSYKCALAFSKIQQAIRGDNLWTAAWCMYKFLKTPHSLSAIERLALQQEYTYWMNRAQDAFNFIERLGFKHATEDINDWLKHGKPFTAVTLESASDGEVFELQAMGSSPGVKNLKNLELVDLD